MDTAMLSSWWTWLLLPASGAAEHHLPAWAAWHGRLMVLAWAFLLPLGVLAARFFKVVPGQRWPDELDHKAWWHAHRLLQSAGMAAMLAGLWLAWGRGTGAGALAQWHHVLGMAVVVLGLLQTLGGLARGSKGARRHAKGSAGTTTT
ncbi:cytochrome b561 domain-containing protein [Paracidovorax avenae]|uniref:cytochrome b561 domain-containing protein n=1 Tax=Paracidovorax avenae TaxID=80867 RepID=UPI001CEFADD8|nr:cytochrome b561 domain-containing protein [Paracidovorax avenae]